MSPSPENEPASPHEQRPETSSENPPPKVHVPRKRLAFEDEPNIPGAVKVSGITKLPTLPILPVPPPPAAPSTAPPPRRPRTMARFEDFPKPPPSIDLPENTLSIPARQAEIDPPTMSFSNRPLPSVAEHTMTGGLGVKQFAAEKRPNSSQTARVPFMTPDEDIAVWKIGDIIDGKYEVTAIAGQGGMGVVYRINHRIWNLEMAVKTPLPALVKDPSARARFIREAQVWVDLGLHPNLVQCWFVRELGGLPRVFVDYLAGGSLKDWFVQGRLKAGQYDKIIDLMAQACDGLGYAHDRGVVHRDIKPGNMLMSEDGRLCITDFGLVKRAGMEDILSAESGDGPDTSLLPATDLTQTGFSLGTPQYGAPEQWGQAKNVDVRADIYALGITLYELCCGRRPFDQPGKGEPAQVIIARHLSSAPPDPRTLRRDLPESLAKLILRCLQKSPDARPSSLSEVRKELEAAHLEIYSREFTRPVPEAAESRASGLNNRAVSMWDLGQPGQAVAAWNEALALDPRHAESLYNCSLMEYRAGKITDWEAAQRLREAARIQKKALLYLGQIQLETCDTVAAQKSLETALKDPSLATDGIAWRALGHSLMAREQFRDAEDAYTKAREIMPGDTESRHCADLARRHVRISGGKIGFPDIGPLRVVEERVGSIHAIAVAADGRSIFTDGGLNAICQFEIPTGKPLDIFSGASKQVLAIAATPDGRLLLCGGEDSQLHAWSLSNKLMVDDFYGKGHIGSICSVAVSSDSRLAATSGSDKSLRLWELHKGALLKTLWGHEDGVTASAFSPDGLVLASGSSDGTLRFWAMPSGEAGRVLRDGVAPVSALAYSENGEFLFSTGSDGRMLKWNCATYECVCEFRGHRGRINALSIVPGWDGRFLATCGDDSTVRLWDATNGNCLRTILGHKGSVLSIGIPADSAVLASGATENLGQPLRLWNLELERFARAPGEADPYAASLAICRIEKLDQSQSASREFNALFNEAAAAFQKQQFSTSYAALKKARKIEGYERDPRALELNRNLAKNLPLKEVAAVYLRSEIEGRHSHGFKAALFTADFQAVLSAGRNDKLIQSWDIENGVCGRKLEGHKQPVEGLALVPGAPLLVSASSDYSLGLWDLNSGILRTSLQGHRAEVNAVAASKDGRLIASASSDGTVRIWEVSSQKCVKTFERENSEEALVAVKFMPDNRHIIVGGREGYLAHYSLVTGKLLHEFPGHFGVIQDLVVFKERPLLISAGEDKTLRCWNVEKGESIWTVKDGKSRFHSVALTPDQRFVFTGGMELQDTQVKMWDAQTGAARGMICPHAKGISALALNDDATVMITATEDKYLRVWDLEWDLIAEDPKSVFSSTASNLKRVTLPNVAAPRPAGTSKLPPPPPQLPPAEPKTARPNPAMTSGIKPKPSIFLNLKDIKDDPAK